ncbi:hypothetical protein O3P69_019943, partial [Scylla paramamosain]
PQRGHSRSKISELLKVTEQLVRTVTRELISSDYDCEGAAERKHHSRRSDTARDAEFVTQLRAMVDEDPSRSMRSIARELQVSEGTWLRSSEVSIEVLQTHVKPWIEEVAAGRPYVWQQDSAPCHTSRKSQKWLSDNFFDFVAPDVWPPNSPDLNPMDYFVWGAVERGRVEDVIDAKSEFIE